MTSPNRRTHHQSRNMLQPMSAIEILSSVAVKVPPAAAWEVIADFARNPEWQRGMKSARWLTEPPLAVGSRYVQHAGFLGRDVRSLFEVIELDPGSQVTIDTVEGTFPITVTRAIAPEGDGCRISANVRGDAGGLFRLVTPLLRALVKRSVDGDYARLKSLLEA